MGGFVKQYQDIFSFSREKIEKEMHVILDYYLNDVDRFDVLNVDLVNDAKTFNERKNKREAYHNTFDPKHTAAVELILENHRTHKKLVHEGPPKMTDEEK